MSTKTSQQTRGTCFVVMGFGKKTDFETGRTLDLDKSYRNLIKPAVEAAGLRCVRADEIVHSGLIDVPMYEQLLSADVVVADLSTSNKNAFYELGVRHALRPHTTLVIAEDGVKTFPFDINHVVVRQYHHLGEDIGYDEVMRFRRLLTDAIVEILDRDPRRSDSPVYAFLQQLAPPSLRGSAPPAVPPAAPAPVDAHGASDASAGDGPEANRGQGYPGAGPDRGEGTAAPQLRSTHSMLMQQVDEAQQRGDFVAAKNFLSFIRGMIRTEAPGRAEDPYIVQRLAFVTYKSKYPTEADSLREARDLLDTLAPATSNDTETLGLTGAVHKRLWELTRDRADLDEAIRAYERGFFLRNDYYNGINLACLLNLRAAASGDPAEAIADFVHARRIREEVLSICEAWLASHPEPKEGSAEALAEYRRTRYWVLATLAEAHIGLGQDAHGEAWLAEAFAIVPESWMRASTEEQLDKLRPMMADSPLRYLRSEPVP